jgi:hypothetical protein
MGCQMQSACGMSGNRQRCMSNADCPAAYPDCRAGAAGGTMYCRTAVDAGTADGGPAPDAGPLDSGSGDSASDAESDGATSDAPSGG